jgi:hypothetical protein
MERGGRCLLATSTVALRASGAVRAAPAFRDADVGAKHVGHVRNLRGTYRNVPRKKNNSPRKKGILV